MSSGYHIPILGSAVRDLLITNPDGVYYDGTLGGGGHADIILHKLSADAIYIGVDRDKEALDYSRKHLKKYANVVYYHGVFNDFSGALKSAKVDTIDGLLLDLGLSSHQIDRDERGFTFSTDAELDMRMNREDSFTAADILNKYNLDDLIRIFRKYGEEKYSQRIARRIVKLREDRVLIHSSDLTGVIDSCTPQYKRIKTYARIFQALRIEVNEELKILEKTLKESLGFLSKGGRIAVISYHSLEDRIVKEFFKMQENPCTCPHELPYCICGEKPGIKRIKPFLIRPDEEEIKKNSRARSAKLRVGEKI